MSVNADLHAAQNFETLENLFNCTFIWCPENCPRGKLPPRKIVPPSGSGFGLGLALELGLGDNFPRG